MASKGMSRKFLDRATNMITWDQRFWFRLLDPNYREKLTPARLNRGLGGSLKIAGIAAIFLELCCVSLRKALACRG
jgi:hypothetical protein